MVPNESTLSSCEVTEIYTDPNIEGLFDWANPNGIIELLNEENYIDGTYLVSCNVTKNFYQCSYYRDWDEEIEYSNLTITKLNH